MLAPASASLSLPHAHGGSGTAAASPVPLVATATSVLIAGGLYAHTNRVVSEVRRELASLRTIVSASNAAAASAETAASRAAVSFQSLTSTLRRDRITETEARDAAATGAHAEVAERVARDVASPIAAELSKMQNTVEALSGAVEEAFARLEAVTARLERLAAEVQQLHALSPRGAKAAAAASAAAGAAAAAPPAASPPLVEIHV